MKKIIHFILAIGSVGFVSQASAQNELPRFDEQFKSIETELTAWDPVRGSWLSSSLYAMANDEPIPDRTFPEDFSPGEMMQLVPNATLTNIRTISQANGQNTNDILQRNRWNRVNNYIYRPDCKLIMGRSYGDPHLKSFDGASYSFQTVGEFVLANANNGQMEVQVRQEPQTDDFSLNTAVAMKVGNDRVGLYANPRNGNSPVMINGFPVMMNGSTYYLPHGGTIRNSGRNYVVTWPTGEKVSVDMRSSRGMSFMDVAVQIYPCATYNYSGLLGDANGSRHDDFNIASRGLSPIFGGEMSDQMEKERLAFLAKDFANNFRVQQSTSLFDYGIGQNTLTFTDYSYPRVHRTINDLPTARRTSAGNTCRAAGLSSSELDACIFDQAFLEIGPTRTPVIRNHTDRVIMKKVDTPVRNVNTPRQVIQDSDIKTTRGQIGNDGTTTRELSSPDQRAVSNDELAIPTPALPKADNKWESSDTRVVDESNQNTRSTIDGGIVTPTEKVNTQTQRVEDAPVVQPTTPKSETRPVDIPVTKVETKSTPRVRTAPTPRPVTRPTPREEAPKPVTRPVSTPERSAPAPRPRVVKPAPVPSTPRPVSRPTPAKTSPSPSRPKPSTSSPSRSTPIGRSGRGL